MKKKLKKKNEDCKIKESQKKAKINKMKNKQKMLNLLRLYTQYIRASRYLA